MRQQNHTNINEITEYFGWIAFVTNEICNRMLTAVQTARMHSVCSLHMKSFEQFKRNYVNRHHRLVHICSHNSQNEIRNIRE